MALFAVMTAAAQNDCISFFPSTPGTVLVNKTYDGQGKLLASTTYTIEDYSDDQDGYDTQISVLMTDSSNNPINRGTMEVVCDDNIFNLKVKYSFLTPEVLKLLSMNTQLLGDFMDYPATYNDDYPFTGNLQKGGGEIQLRTNSDSIDLVKIRIFNRYHQKKESVTTPANTFETSKITFDFQVSQGAQETNYKGIEWYAKDAGIVRSETRDENDNLVNYTELSLITTPVETAE